MLRLEEDHRLASWLDDLDTLMKEIKAPRRGGPFFGYSGRRWCVHALPPLSVITGHLPLAGRYGRARAAPHDALTAQGCQ